MESEKINIRLCMGSSCYSRGNDEILKIVQNYLEVNNLDDKVDLRGHLCKGNCNKGPNMSIGSKEYHEVSLSNIHLILKDTFENNHV